MFHEAYVHENHTCTVHAPFGPSLALAAGALIERAKKRDSSSDHCKEKKRMSEENWGVGVGAVGTQETPLT